MCVKISSPSRPASQALTMRSTSFRLSSLWIRLSWVADFLSRGRTLNSVGMIGRFSSFQDFQAGS